MFYKQIQMLKPRRSPRAVTLDTKTGANSAVRRAAAPPEPRSQRPNTTYFPKNAAALRLPRLRQASTTRAASDSNICHQKNWGGTYFWASTNLLGIYSRETQLGISSAGRI